MIDNKIDSYIEDRGDRSHLNLWTSKRTYKLKSVHYSINSVFSGYNNDTSYTIQQDRL